MKTAAFTILALAMACAAQAQTNVYRWVDKDGKVQYSDSLPPESASNVTQKRLGGGLVDEGQLPYATRDAMKRNPVSLYSTNGCGELCAQGRTVLNNRGIPYADRNPETNKADADSLRKLVGGLEMPVLVVGERALKGFDEDTWQAALDSAGYPRTKLPGQVGGPRQPDAK
jgi:hypothetical protein